MYRKDYFLKMTQELAKILAKALGFKEAGQLDRASKVIHEAYGNLFDLNREYFLNKDSSLLIEALTTEYKFKSDQLEALARLFFEDAELSEEKDKKNLYAKSLSILEYLNLKQKMYSFEREGLIKLINERLLFFPGNL